MSGTRSDATDGGAVGYCPACESEVVEWLPGPGGRPRAGCPSCGSLERHRHLALVLRGLRPLLSTSDAILEASPQPQTRRVIESITESVLYVRTDLMVMPTVDVTADGLALPFRSGSFDLVVHFHTFEHIIDDRSAMREVARVLAPGGIMLCQVPRREGVLTEEDFTLNSEQRQAQYGQFDHVRIYGDDFEDRLVESGFVVSSHTAADVLEESDQGWFNIPGWDRIWSCRPTESDGASAALASAVDELESTRAELEAIARDRDQLRSRKVVRAGLGLASLARPFFAAARLRRGSDGEVREPK